VDALTLLLLPGMIAAATAFAPAACPLAMQAGSALHADTHAPGLPPPPRPACGPRARAESRLAGARTLLVQFQRLSPAIVDRVDPDVLIADYSWDGTGDRALTRWDVRRLRWRLGGPPRAVLAYVSVGEAEDYRYYWKSAARGGAASFLDRPNPRWPGNVRVRFWDPAWRSVLFGGRDSWIDRILDAGFDGVFLDTVDVAEAFADEGDPRAPSRMADLVTALARHARQRDPGFLVVASNAFALLDRPGVAEALSGVVGEGDLPLADTPAARAAAEARLVHLRHAADLGAQVLLIEYPRSPAARQRFSSLCSSEGFLCYAGVEALDRPGTPVPRDPRKETQR